MPEQTSEPTGLRPPRVAVVGLMLAGLAVALLLLGNNFLLFHSMVELVGAAVACSIGMIAWNTRSLRRDHHMLLLGLALGAAGGMGMVHALSHPGMTVFLTVSEDAAFRVWVIARAGLALALLLGPIIGYTRLAATPTALAIGIGALVATGACLHTGLVPTCLGPDGSPTPPMRAAEAAIAATMLAALALHWRTRDRYHPRVLGALSGAILLAVVTELCFATMHDPTDRISAFGHVAELLSYLLLYWALVHLSLSEPYVLLLRELAHSVQALEQQAHRDELTGLYNRRGFMLLGEAQLALTRRLGMNATVIFADLNGLKQLNDEHGHTWGDRALQDTAALLRRTFRGADLIARVGGDEFVALLTHGSRGTPLPRLRAAIDRFNRGNDRPYTLSIALGACPLAANDQGSLDDMLALADAEMYTDKQRHYQELDTEPREREGSHRETR